MGRLAARFAGSFVVFASAACGSSGGGGAGPSPDAGAPADAEGTAVTVTQHGRIVDFDTGKAIANATIVAGARTVTTGADGTYALRVDQGAAFTMNVTAPNYIKLLEQATTLGADEDRGDTKMVSKSTSDLLRLALPEYDASRGVLSVQLLPRGGCAHVAGAKVKVADDDAKIIYFYRSFPQRDLDEAKDGELPSVVIYNLPTGVAIDVTVQHGSCKKAAFPYTDNGITYLGDVTTEPGDATAFERIFLE